MKRLTPFILLVLPLALGLLGSQSRPRPAMLAAGQFRQRVVECEKAFAELHAAAQLEPVGSTRLLRFLALARVAYKRCEWLLEYWEPQYARDHLNGPPLPRLEREAATPNVLPPEGLQALEELIYAEEKDSVARAEALSRKLLARFRQLSHRLQAVEPNDREVFEAGRMELVRLFALGLTGYDTPASGLALREALVGVQELERVFSFYDKELRNRKPDLARRLNQLWRETTSALKKAEDFDSFDRLGFLRRCVDPLYAGLLDAQEALGIESSIEVHARQPTPWNPQSRSLFAADFLNASWYLRENYGPEAVALGRDLFREKALSEDGSLSCATCHQADRAFTDGHPLSLGRGGKTLRNSPTLVNAVFATRYFYDLRAERLEDQVDHVVANDAEFGTDYLRLCARLDTLGDYRARFLSAFPQQAAQPVSRHTVTAALAAYVASLQGMNSPFDRYARGETDTLNAAQAGFNLFMGRAGCGACHFAPVFNGGVPPQYVEMESEVIGTPDRPDQSTARLSPDPGRRMGREKERVETYRHSFRTPTVRNSALTAPYMHNGVFTNLTEVINFYHNGGGKGWGLDVPNQTLPNRPVPITAADRRNLIAFLEALTDVPKQP